VDEVTVSFNGAALIRARKWRVIPHFV